MTTCAGEEEKRGKVLQQICGTTAPLKMKKGKEAQYAILYSTPVPRNSTASWVLCGLSETAVFQFRTKAVVCRTKHLAI
jgi:hypothetical protein